MTTRLSVFSTVNRQYIADITRGKMKDGTLQVLKMQQVFLEDDLLQDDFKMSTTYSGLGSELESTSSLRRSSPRCNNSMQVHQKE